MSIVGGIFQTQELARRDRVNSAAWRARGSHSNAVAKSSDKGKRYSSDKEDKGASCIIDARDEEPITKAQIYE